MTSPPPLPPGREMDAAVAVAMGWKQDGYEDPDGFVFNVPVWQLHDWIERMLAWLQGWAGDIEVLWTCGDSPDPSVGYGGWPAGWCVRAIRGDIVEAEGTTLPEALSRLVLAVAARRAT